MTILFISYSGRLLGLASRCQSEEFPVSLYVESEHASFVGNGIVPKPSFSKHLTNKVGECIASSINQLLSETSPDLVVVDSISLGKVADYIREQKVPVFGSSLWTDTLSSSQLYTNDILSRVGIRRWKGEEGVRVSLSTCWNGLSLSHPYLTVNNEKFMSGSLGPSVPSSAHLSMSFDQPLDKMERLLKKSKFRGIITLDCILTKHELYGVRFLPYDLYLPSMLEMYKGSIVDFLLAISTGRSPEGQLSTDLALSLLLSIPPFPVPISTYAPSPLAGVSPSNIRHLYPIDIQRNSDIYESASSGGELLYVTAHGRNISECRKRVFQTISNLDIPYVQYIIDPTTYPAFVLRKLNEWGLI